MQRPAVTSEPAVPRLAAVTMVYNEAVLLPLWQRHYARQVGAAHCYVLDHGSFDGCADDLRPASVIRLPRSPHDDARRARAVSRICEGLLEWYDAVIYTDVDELVLADPARHADLRAFAATNDAAAVTAIGLNVMQMPTEPPLDPQRAVLAQRAYAAFSSALCKPVLIRRPVTWAPGFHCADAPLRFDDLFLFHLRYCDRDAALMRLAKTRDMPWSDRSAGAHQRVSDAEFAQMLDNFARMERRDDIVLARDQPPLSVWLQAVADSQAGREHAMFTLDLQLNAYELWPIPIRFRTET